MLDDCEGKRCGYNQPNDFNGKFESNRTKVSSNKTI